MSVTKGTEMKSEDPMAEVYARVAKLQQGRNEKMRLRSHIKEIAKSEKQLEGKEGFIPCLFMPYLMGSSKLLIYFHGNAEDIGLSMELLIFVRDMLKVSFISKTINILTIGARAGHGVPRLRNLRWKPRSRLDCFGRAKCFRLPYSSARYQTRSDYSLWALYWIGPCNACGI